MGDIYRVLSLFVSFISFPLYQPVFHLALRDSYLPLLVMSHILGMPAAPSSLGKEIKSASAKEGKTKEGRRLNALACKIQYEQSPEYSFIVNLMYGEKLMTSDDVDHFPFS
jgi:hypothetical protein